MIVKNAAGLINWKDESDVSRGQIYHNQDNDFVINNPVAAGDLFLQRGGTTVARTNGDPFYIYHAGSQKFGTYSAGVQMLQNTDNFDMQDGTMQFGTSWANHSLGDHGISGITWSFQAGENISAGEFIYVADNGKAFGTHTLPSGASRRICGYTPSAVSSGNNFVALVMGIIQDSSWTDVWAASQACIQFGEYNPKQIANVGTASGTTYQVVGFGLTTDTLFFYPSGSVYEVK